MLLRIQTLTLAILTALLIIIGGFGMFIVEASSFHGIMIEAQSYDPGAPYGGATDAFDFGADTDGANSGIGLPY